MYNLIIYLYLLGVAVYSRFNEKVRKMWRGERDAFRVLRERVEPGARYAWFHAASLGEFEQGRPLMEQLRRDHPEMKILLTFFSPSGYEVRKDYKGADIICYLPLDTIRNARRFLRLIRPEVAFFIKYEFWYNYLHILKHRGVPTYSVSSIFREGQVFFRWYGHQYGRVLKCFTHFYVQNEKSRELLAGIGIDCVTVVGDTRFDRVLQVKEQVPRKAAADLFDVFVSDKKCFIAGSSWEPDEDIFLPYFSGQRREEWRLIIAPHVLSEEHIARIENQASALGMECKTLSHVHALIDSYYGDFFQALGRADILIIDSFGQLSSIYRYATVCYVGGGFGTGIHNTLEAAVWGKPVIFGPENQKFQEAQGLKACGGGFEIKNYEDFEQLMDRLGSDNAYCEQAGQQAGDYVQSLAGATQKTLSDIEL